MIGDDGASTVADVAGRDGAGTTYLPVDGFTRTEATCVVQPLVGNCANVVVGAPRPIQGTDVPTPCRNGQLPGSKKRSRVMAPSTGRSLSASGQQVSAISP